MINIRGKVTSSQIGIDTNWIEDYNLHIAIDADDGIDTYFVAGKVFYPVPGDTKYNKHYKTPTEDDWLIAKNRDVIIPKILVDDIIDIRCKFKYDYKSKHTGLMQRTVNYVRLINHQKTNPRWYMQIKRRTGVDNVREWFTLPDIFTTEPMAQKELVKLFPTTCERWLRVIEG